MMASPITVPLDHEEQPHQLFDDQSPERFCHCNVTSVTVDAPSTGNGAVPIPAPRFGHTSVVYGDDMIMFGGRDDHFLNDVWRLHLPSKRWFPCAARGQVHAPTARAGHTAVVMRDRMYVFGGGTSLQRCTNTVESLNLRTLQWESLPPATTDTVPSPRKGHTMLRVDDDTMLLFAGGTEAQVEADLWMYRPSTRAWTRLTPSGPEPPSRMYHVAEYCPDRQTMLVFGGRSKTANFFLNDLYEFHLGFNTWRRVVGTEGPPPCMRMCSTSFFLNGTLCVLMGGSMRYHGDIYEYDVSLNKWRQVRSDVIEKVPRTRPTVVVHNNSVTMFGGCSSGGYVNDIIDIHLEPPSLRDCVRMWLIENHLLSEVINDKAMTPAVRNFLSLP